ncbi:MAG: TorD/DmsD family molecular chaperone [Coriobacteriia bacterium]
MRVTTLEARGRAWLYGLLGRVFDDVPDAELTARLVDESPRLAGLARALGAGDASIDTLENIEVGDAEAMGIEYTSLFEMHDRIYPFASCWTGEKPRLMREPWAAANAFYRRLGLGLTEERLARADHIGTELSFMSVLAGRLASAVDEAEASAAAREFDTFLASHVLAWAGRFCAAVMADRRSRYYSAYAELLSYALAAESALEGEQVTLMSTDSLKEVGQ